ncbi:tail fiber/spike domain-containing protein [Enterobacter roggenkampii]|uniref:tail fiber/spike domain-containing protein n=1 Tax=Enterobacter roggenkampii TaxID=1812935 RepID=UPI002A7EC36D|nr:glycosyl hydrolase family 28-related protein [Enterobacter roggenkampii]
MATQPTNLPVPSESPRDLKYNAGKIDEFATSMGWTYTDRFGVQHYTIEGMRWLAQQAIAAFGYITLDSFEDGNTLTLPNQVLRLEANGEYYRWDGAFPKTVPAGSTPDTTGGIGPGKWLSVGDAALRQQLASDSDSLGDGLVTTKQPYTGAKTQTVHTKLAQVINVLDFEGVVGDGVNDDTAGIQAAVDATPQGGTLNIPSGTFVLTDEIIIQKSITIKGTGGRILSDTLDSDCIIQKNSGKCIFRFRATANGYLFGQYGLTAVHFYDLNLIGPSNTSRSTYAFACDESVASGAYHFRGWSFNNVNFRYFVYGFYLRGIIYLGCFNRVRGTRCNAFALIDNLSGSNDLCGQIRFHQCEGTFCDNGLMLSLESQTGDYAVSQSTLAHGDKGIQFGWACHIDIGDDVSLEDNRDCGIYTIIPASVSNPNCEAAKNIRGIKFIGNGDDIWINKETTAYSGGGFSWPMYIDGNTFAGTTRKILKITGNSPFDSQQFVFGVSNTYSGGLVPLSKIDSNFRGYNAIKEQGKISISANVTATTDTNVATFTIPAGKSCIISKYSAISLSTNASGGNARYAAAVRFTDATNSIVLKDVSGIVAGEDFVIASSGNSRDVVVSLRSDAAGHTATLSFTYKFY